MSYDDMPIYVRENFLKNRLDALLKPIMGKIYDTNAPGYWRNDRIESAASKIDVDLDELREEEEDETGE